MYFLTKIKHPLIPETKNLFIDHPFPSKNPTRTKTTLLKPIAKGGGCSVARALKTAPIRCARAPNNRKETEHPRSRSAEHVPERDLTIAGHCVGFRG